MEVELEITKFESFIDKAVPGYMISAYFGGLPIG